MKREQGRMEQISVIVPIYHGKKYIDSMITQIEKCAGVCHGKYVLELFFVNDDPQEPIGIVSAGKVAVRVLETDRNRGIHGARVRGLLACTGDYVLFLDQDDRIQPEYFISQLAYLKEADLVVCKLIHEGRQFYDTRMSFEQVVTAEFILSVRNPIISPGQVLIRKEKIPQIWKNAELKHNGADDWLLWLCLLGTGAVFALNPEILFEHVVSGNSESVNVVHMIASEQEIYEVIARAGIFSREDLEKLYGAVRAAAEEHIRLLSKFQKMFFIYDDVLKLQHEGRHLHDYLKNIGVGSVAIYGDSPIGKRLYYSLQDSDVEVGYFIDRNADYLEEEIPVYLPGPGLPPVDMVIIALVEGTDNIRQELGMWIGTRIRSIAELLEEMK